MTDDNRGGQGPVERPTERIIEASDVRKGIVVMPVDAAPMIDIQNLAPSGPPAPQQAAPADPPALPPSSDS
jgi:hypothetical protein